MKILTVLGTRPELIKLSEVIKKLETHHSIEHKLVHTGQNFTPELKDFFFKDLELREPDYYLNVNTGSYGAEVADIIKKTDEIFENEKPDGILLLGDTYSCLSIMPAAQKKIKIFHMEAGLRAWDKRMPEQRNRILIDHMSDILLPFNNYHRENLLRENIHPSKIFVTGNPTFEILRRYSKNIEESSIIEKLGLKKKDFFLLTFHRSENVDDEDNFIKTLKSFDEIGAIHKKLVVYPIHPRSRDKLKKKKIDFENLKLIDALGYYDYNKLSKECYCILSDSGTAPEEGIFYNVPSVTVRDTSERYEVVESGLNIVSGLKRKNIIQAVSTITSAEKKKTYYNLEIDRSPSDIVVNLINSNFTHYF